MVYTEDMITKKLKTYREQKRNLELLRFELNHSSECLTVTSACGGCSATPICSKELQYVENQLYRLEYYVQLLAHPYYDVIHQLYFLKKSWCEIQDSLSFSRRTLMRYRTEAVKQLVEMYNYTHPFCSDLAEMQ